MGRGWWIDWDLVEKRLWRNCARAQNANNFDEPFVTENTTGYSSRQQQQQIIITTLVAPGDAIHAPLPRIHPLSNITDRMDISWRHSSVARDADCHANQWHQRTVYGSSRSVDEWRWTRAVYGTSTVNLIRESNAFIVTLYSMVSSTVGNCIPTYSIGPIYRTTSRHWRGKKSVGTTLARLMMMVVKPYHRLPFLLRFTQLKANMYSIRKWPKILHQAVPLFQFTWNPRPYRPIVL
jgi:hypothetical protein